MQNLFEQLKKSNYLSRTVSQYDFKSRNIFKNINGSLLAFVACYLAEKEQKSLLFITPDSLNAETFYEDCKAINDFDKTAIIPEILELPYDQRKPNPGKISLRLESLEKISAGNNIIVSMPATALFDKFPKSEKIRQSRLEFKVGETFEFELISEFLSELGYNRTELVDEMGDYAIRGGIVDIYSWSAEKPVRLEFWDDEVESIREFDILSQRSVKQLKSVSFPGMEKESDKDQTIFDLLPGAIVWLDEPYILENKLKEKWEQITNRYEYVLNHEEEARKPEYYFWPVEDITLRFELPGTILTGLSMEKNTKLVDFHSETPAKFAGNVQNFPQFIACLKKKWQKVFIYADIPEQVERLNEIIFDTEEDGFGGIGIRHSGLSAGFAIKETGLMILTHHQLFRQLRRRKTIRKINSASYLRALRSLLYNDFVVHVDYGIGVFKGLEKIKVGGIQRECVRLEYDNGESLYVHLDKINKIQKYSSQEGSAPAIHKLGGKAWERVKGRTRSAIDKIARELVEIYAQRANTKGYAFSTDTKWQVELEASFPYEDTPDQEITTKAVKEDMEKNIPMDRLICGDVGFGKTEIAVRAAFKAVQDSKQVAILAPTTLLASQHFETFKERMPDFPVNIAVLSRFETPKKQKLTLEGLKKGSVDIVIGTHRLLSADVSFKDLGLLVVDEEQRFGVKHKEKLKSLRLNVDVLSMTATPIPRTLHMSLIGVRGLSNIETPPRNRRPIITSVMQWEEEQIYQAIISEISREGQVFFVHNRVETIEAIKVMLEKIVPEASFAVAHGQMPERKLEKVMHDFKKQKFDVLVASMIIENGLDIPSTNTIIINNADKFGLSQLYQLRGRVGRSDVQAYAYLISPHPSKLTDVAIKRLHVIQEFTELGSGFKLALRDLEIRGAGNLLGHQQSGFINAVGFELFVKILNEAIEELKKDIDHPGEIKSLPPVETIIDVDADLFFPHNFIANANERLTYYHRILAVKDVDEIEDMAEELKDRFGPLPPEATNIIQANRIRILAGKYQVGKIFMRKNTLKIFFIWHDLATEDMPSVNFKSILESPHLRNVEFEQGDDFVLKAVIKGLTLIERLDGLEAFLKGLEEEKKSRDLSTPPNTR